MHVKVARPLFNAVIAVIFILTLGHSAVEPVQSAYTPVNPAATKYDPMTEVIEKYRSLIPEVMKQKNILGSSVALVDNGKVLWSEGFGYTDWDRKTPVTADTPFSIQSMSKVFTATAVMLAVQEGLVDLDTPISEYLPNFQINSVFESNPAEKITLRHLLSHTAGFTHEAPLGNNYNSNVVSFEDHVASIQQTWLKFPVGEGYGYSNLGIDLAAYILQVRSGMPFTQYVQQKLLDPLGMVNSTYNLEAIKNNPGKAVGQASILTKWPLCPLLGSGGLYSTANDIARYIQFLSNAGKVDGNQLLDNAMLETMGTAQYSASAKAKYGLGIGIDRAFNTLILYHGGGGFGFGSLLVWYPELKLGLVWLTNSNDNDLQDLLNDQFLVDLVTVAVDTYTLRVVQNTLPPTKFFTPDDVQPLTSDDLEKTIADLALQTSPESINRWKRFTGIYSAYAFGIVGEIHRIHLENDSLYFDDQKLYEVQPGLFFSPDGEALDVRGRRPHLPQYRVIEKLHRRSHCKNRFPRSLWCNLYSDHRVGPVFCHSAVQEARRI